MISSMAGSIRLSRTDIVMFRDARYSLILPHGMDEPGDAGHLFIYTYVPGGFPACCPMDAHLFRPDAQNDFLPGALYGAPGRKRLCFHPPPTRMSTLAWFLKSEIFQLPDQ